MRSMLTDVRYAVRVLRRRPAFLFASITTIALGVGTACASFGLVDAVLLRPLPVADEARLVLLQTHDVRQPALARRLASDFHERLRARTSVFTAFGRVHGAGPTPVAARIDGREFPASFTYVDGGFFDVLGVRPALGRLLTPEDDRSGAEAAVVLGHRVWTREFGADPAIAGRRMEIGGRPVVIVGVAAAGFEFPRGSDMWQPMATLFAGIRSQPAPDTSYFDLIARLDRRVDIDTARQHFARVVEEHYSGAAGGPRLPTVTSWRTVIVGGVAPSLMVLAFTVGLILVLSCLNVAGLVLTRALGRMSELRVRAALGASAGRLVTMLVIENGLIAALGGGLGVVLAGVLLAGARRVSGGALVRFDAAVLNASVLWFAGGLIVAALVVFGVLPVLRVVRPGRRSIAASTRTGAGQTGMRGRSAIAAVQIALSLTVLSGAALLAQSDWHVRQAHLGFDPSEMVIVGLQTPPRPRATPEDRARMIDWHLDLRDALEEHLPGRAGILSATVLDTLPFGGVEPQTSFVLEGQGAVEAVDNPRAVLMSRSPTFFPALALSPTRGRTFTRDDTASATQVAVVSESFARWAWPGGDWVGRRVGLGTRNVVWREVVGVVDDIRWSSATRPPRPTIYIPVRQDPQGPGVYLAVRAAGDPGAAVPAIRAALNELAPGSGLRSVDFGEALLAAPLAPARFATSVLAVLAAAALIISVAGLSGLLMFSIAQRRAEIGVRMTLGATPADIRRMIVSQSGRIAAAGIVAGLGLTLLVSRALDSLLFGVNPTDAPTLAAAAATLALAALIVGAAAGGRAARLDPMRTLRS